MSHSSAYVFDSSDEEDASSPESQLRYAMSYVVRHGKAFKGQSISDVMKTQRGRDYLRWSLDEFTDLHPSARKHITFALAYYSKQKGKQE